MERRILRNKTYLYLTEFFAGMSVMAVELGASRLLAPYFSSSQIVWTIIIGTIMIAMALGNLYGGRTADKNPNPDRLYARILFASVWIAAIPVVGKYIILGISGLLIFTVSSNFLIIAGFAACMATRGGVACAELDPRTLASRRIAGLHCIGESVEPVGPCGGYNLSWAWASAWAAARGER